MAAALRLERQDLFVLGIAVISYTFWMRPDSPLLGVVLAALLFLNRRWWWREIPNVMAIIWFLCGCWISMRITGLVGDKAISIAGFLRVGRWWYAPWRELLVPPIVPLWFIPAVLFGYFTWRGRAARMAWAGVAAGLFVVEAQADLGSVGPAETYSTYTELFRYGTLALTWNLLFIGVGIAAVTAMLGPRARILLTVGAALVLLAMPLIHRGYLARTYASRQEEEIFQAAYEALPQQCGLVVPDDTDDLRGRGTWSTSDHFYTLVGMAVPLEHRMEAFDHVIGAAEFVRQVRQLHQLPISGGGPNRPQIPLPCWYFFRGAYCETGTFEEPSATCADMEHLFKLTPVHGRTVEFFSARLLSRPQHLVPPFYNPAFSFDMLRIDGLKL